MGRRAYTAYHYSHLLRHRFNEDVAVIPYRPYMDKEVAWLNVLEGYDIDHGKHAYAALKNGELFLAGSVVMLSETEASISISIAKGTSLKPLLLFCKDLLATLKGVSVEAKVVKANHKALRFAEYMGFVVQPCIMDTDCWRMLRPAQDE